VGFLDDAKKKLGEAVNQHGDKINEGLDKAGQKIDERTGGKHAGTIRTGVGKAKEALAKADATRPQAGPGRDDLSATSTPVPPAGPSGPANDPARPTGPAGPQDPAAPITPDQPGSPAGPISSPMGSRSQDGPCGDSSTGAPLPGADPNADIATGTRPAPSGGAA